MGFVCENLTKTLIAGTKFNNHDDLDNINQAPNVTLIRKKVRKFEETGSTVDKPKLERPRSSGTYEIL